MTPLPPFSPAMSQSQFSPQQGMHHAWVCASSVYELLWSTGLSTTWSLASAPHWCPQQMELMPHSHTHDSIGSYILSFNGDWLTGMSPHRVEWDKVPNDPGSVRWFYLCLPVAQETHCLMPSNRSGHSPEWTQQKNTFQQTPPCTCHRCEISDRFHVLVATTWTEINNIDCGFAYNNVKVLWSLPCLHRVPLTTDKNQVEIKLRINLVNRLKWITFSFMICTLL